MHVLLIWLFQSEFQESSTNESSIHFQSGGANKLEDQITDQHANHLDISLIPLIYQSVTMSKSPPPFRRLSVWQRDSGSAMEHTINTSVEWHSFPGGTRAINYPQSPGLVLGTGKMDWMHRRWTVAKVKMIGRRRSLTHCISFRVSFDGLKWLWSKEILWKFLH